MRTAWGFGHSVCASGFYRHSIHRSFGDQTKQHLGRLVIQIPYLAIMPEATADRNLCSRMSLLPDRTFGSVTPALFAF